LEAQVTITWECFDPTRQAQERMMALEDKPFSNFNFLGGLCRHFFRDDAFFFTERGVSQILSNVLSAICQCSETIVGTVDGGNPAPPRMNNSH